MLRKFAAVLLATTLIAGPVFAAQPSGGAGAPAATTVAPAGAKTQTVTTKPSKMVKHVRKHGRKHVARGKVTTMTMVRHFKSTKTHRGHVAHIAKPGKLTTNGKSAA